MLVMNIEEERKAFEAQEKCNTDMVNELYSPGVQNRWVGWLAAKAHAAEMAKPVIRIHETMGYKWGLYLPSHHRALEVKQTRELAEAWAKDNGYRVIE